jgi:hypothetical protein|tara:strand:+ start:422 stop:1363 length:942 start_codon:yes stop_codon:yes gene_type:complete
MDIYKQVFVTSINQAVNRARATGLLNLDNLAIYNLYKRALEFTEGKVAYIEDNKCFKDVLSQLKYKYPKDICNYKQYVPTIGNIELLVNDSPTVDPFTISLLLEEKIFFTPDMFTTNFSDPNNHGFEKVILYLNGLAGTFEYNGTVIATTLEIDVADVVNLSYQRSADAAFSFSLPFRVSDDYALSRKWTGIVNNTLDGTIIGNQPAVIGDNTIVAANRAVTVLTLAMFTSELTPPYSDPEADLIDAIRLDEISLANLGTFYLNAIEVVEGQIITREDINAGLFTHEGPNQDTISSDNFSFSARDEGSLVWVT